MNYGVTILSAASVERLETRQLNQQEITEFAAILSRAAGQQEPATQFLQSLSQDELKLVQKAHSLARPIQLSALSREGAQNLLSQPDGSDLVDLNNDGLVEVGEGKTIHFPPVNAPASVKAAWQKATAELSESEKATLALTMHHMVYGVHIDLPEVSPKAALPPEQQWNQTNIKALYDYAQSNLQFRINMEGWTSYNKMLNQVYERFFSAITTLPAAGLTRTRVATTQGNAISAQVTNAETTTPEVSAPKSPLSRQQQINQLLLDARLGIERHKIKELEEKMEAVRSDSTLSSMEKRDKLLALQASIEQLIKQAQQRTIEEEKRRATL